MDRNAVYAGACCQALAFALLYLTLPLTFAAGSLVVGGLVTGWYSGSYEEEYIDGAAASALGLCASLVVVVINNWLALPTDVLRYKIDYALLTTLHLSPVVILSIPVAGAVGCVAGHVAATLQRAYGRPPA